MFVLVLPFVVLFWVLCNMVELYVYVVVGMDNGGTCEGNFVEIEGLRSHWHLLASIEIKKIFNMLFKFPM